MEKACFIRQGGVVRLPPGFRFHPTDEELVVQYLKRKVFSCPLPAAVIPEIELSKYDPWDLPGNPGKERYFFNIREAKYPNGKRPNRASAAGYWKATGKDRSVVAPRCNHQVVGMKKTLVFYRGKAPRGSKTDWVMHEYRLAGPTTQACLFPQRKNTTHGLLAPREDWVLCRVFRKRKAISGEAVAVEEEDEDAVGGRGRLIDFMGRGDAEGTAPPLDAERSRVTEAYDSCGGGGGEGGGHRGAS